MHNTNTAKMDDDMPEGTLVGISQTQQERLSSIDFKACFLNTVGRSVLVSRFGIKAAAATRDITLYRALDPNNLEYDTRAKSYTRSNAFEPFFDYFPKQALAALAYSFGNDCVGTHREFIVCEMPAQLNALHRRLFTWQL